MPTNLVSIEYAHIYTNQSINDEHELSLSVLSDVKQSLSQTHSKSALVVMVDDYSFPDPTFNYASFIDWLTKNGYEPDLLVRESQLIPACDQVIAIMKESKLKVELIDYIKAKRYPCSLFIAAWYLARLGKIKNSIVPQNLVADSLFNILPLSFKPFEDKGLEIIKSTPFADAVDNITYKFIDGRLIA